ncbi:MAG: hypothetical protein WD066_14215 [Planctomycetaceae bacterium]
MTVESEILVPSLFFGSTAETKERWAEVIESVWEEGSWTAAHAALADKVNILDSDEPIVVWNNDRLWASSNRPIPWRTDQPVWQMNWILEHPPAPFDELVANSEKHFALFLEGMRHLWFAIGLLEGDRTHLPFAFDFSEPGRIHARHDNEFQRRFLMPFIEWLPHMLPLDARIATASGRKGKGLELTGLARRLGFALDPFFLAGLISQPDVISLLTERDANEVVGQIASLARTYFGFAEPS